jgi:thioester reductase-like protein
VTDIHHNGAFVNMGASYRDLRAANISGTVEVLRLASEGLAKHVHYVSTLGVFGEGQADGPFPEREATGEPGDLPTGYAQTKWVAERLVAAARERGIDATIYRPGRITGDSRTGAWSEGDLVCRLIQACVDEGEAPEVDTLVDMTPADFVSMAIARLSRLSTGRDEVFHLMNPHPISFEAFVDELRAAGYSVRSVPLSRWVQRLHDKAGADPAHPYHALAALIPVWARTPWRGAGFSSERTAMALSRVGIQCPRIDAALVGRYVCWLVANGHLAAAA